MDDRFRDEQYVPDIVPDSDAAYFMEADRYGHTVGMGDSPAVLVVDMTLAFATERPAVGDRCVESIAELLDVARSDEIPVVYTRPHSPGTYPPDYPVTTKGKPDETPSSEEHEEWLSQLDEIAPRVEPSETDLVVDKPRASAFFDTHLANYFHYRGIDTLVVCGMTTSVCVRSTVVDAHSSNFRVVVPPECVGDPSTISHEVTLFDLSMKFADVVPLDTVRERLATFGPNGSRSVEE